MMPQPAEEKQEAVKTAAAAAASMLIPLAATSSACSGLFFLALTRDSFTPASCTRFLLSHFQILTTRAGVTNVVPVDDR